MAPPDVAKRRSVVAHTPRGGSTVSVSAGRSHAAQPPARGPPAAPMSLRAVPSDGGNAVSPNSGSGLPASTQGEAGPICRAPHAVDIPGAKPGGVSRLPVPVQPPSTSL